MMRLLRARCAAAIVVAGIVDAIGCAHPALRPGDRAPVEGARSASLAPESSDSPKADLLALGAGMPVAAMPGESLAGNFGVADIRLAIPPRAVTHAARTVAEVPESARSLGIWVRTGNLNLATRSVTLASAPGQVRIEVGLAAPTAVAIEVKAFREEERDIRSSAALERAKAIAYGSLPNITLRPGAFVRESVVLTPVAEVAPYRPTLRVSGPDGTDIIAAGGGLVLQEGVGFPPAALVVLNFLNPQGRRLAPAAETAGQDGTFRHAWDPSPTVMLGTYEWWAAYSGAGAAGETDHNKFTVTAPPTVVSPSLHISPATVRIAKKPCLQETGEGFMPNSPLVAHFRLPDGRVVDKTDWASDAEGKVTREYCPSPTDLPGPYAWWITYQSGGRTANTNPPIKYEMLTPFPVAPAPQLTVSSSSNKSVPVVKIDKGWFVESGTGFLPGSPITHHFEFQGNRDHSKKRMDLADRTDASGTFSKTWYPKTANGAQVGDYRWWVTYISDGEATESGWKAYRVDR